MARILVVDDEPHLARLMTVWLRQNGHEITQADNGLTALELLNRCDFELLVTDVSMPHMDGLKLIEALGERELPHGIIVLTARHDYEHLSSLYSKEHIRLLPKPFPPKRILKLIEELLAPAPVGL